MSDLWSQFRVRMIDVGNWYRFRFIEEPFNTPRLDEYVAAYRDEKGNSFPATDLVPRRVGILDSGKAMVYINGFYYLRCTPISWGQWIMMNKPEVRELLPGEERFHISGVTAAIYTLDRKFIVSFRSDKVAVYRNMWDCIPAETVDLANVQSTGGVIRQVYDGVEKEAGVDREDVTKVLSLGLCEHLVSDVASIEVCAMVETRLDAAEVLERAGRAKEKWEGRKRIAVSRYEAQEMLTKEQFKPTGAAALMLALMRTG